MVAWLFGIAATLAVFCANRVAHADWPSARHDLSRTGMASGTSNMTKPIPYWRQFMGGALGTGGVVVADLDGDGANELAYVAGGRAVARKVDGTTIWTSPLNALTQIVGAFDLDGNGSLEVIATSVDRVFVYSGTTGDLLWAETQGEMGAIGLVRVADFTHDGAADILVVECGCCSVTSGNTGFLYSFATGFANPQRLWSLPSIGCGSGWSTTAFDPDGTGTLFAFQGAANQASVLNGATGAVLATVTGLPAQAQAMQCLATDVDGLPGEELVCLLNWTVAAPNGHQGHV